MRIVADSNVLLSAIVGEGPPFGIVSLTFQGATALVFSRETFGELAAVLMTRPPFERLSREVRAAYLGHLAEVGAWHRPTPAPVKCRDPLDQMFLDLAISAGTDYLVTGDEDLLVLGQVGATKIRAPGRFSKKSG